MLQLTTTPQTVSQIATANNLTNDQARYRINKMLKAGEITIANPQDRVKQYASANSTETPETELTVNHSYSDAVGTLFNVNDNRQKHLAIHFAASYKTDKRNAQVAMSKFINSDRKEATFYGMAITK